MNNTLTRRAVFQLATGNRPADPWRSPSPLRG